MAFIHDDFLLGNKTSRRLYHEFAETQPILDFHNHLSPSDIASNRQFANLWEAWLEHDHYKWRAMRANGVDERLITGDASPRDKFLAWAATVPCTLRNPLHHWTHLELKRYFGIDDFLNEQTAPQIWEQTCTQLADSSLSVHGILGKFNVTAICTTDDPADTLAHHQQIAASSLKTRVCPTFRPDRAFSVHDPAILKNWLASLEKATDSTIHSLDTLLSALKKRHDDFHTAGCRVSDHGIESLAGTLTTEARAKDIFESAFAGKAATPTEREQFMTYMMLHFGRWNAARGWTMQMHVGPMRNNNKRLMEMVGADAGCDSIGDARHAQPLALLMGQLDYEAALPKTVLYNLNPADNYVFGGLVGNFQDGKTAGKIQLGSGWWFMDQKEGMEWQINTLSNLGLLSRFIGMVTDSRSFLSFPRHEYFRRILCNLLGADIEAGLIPDHDDLLKPLLENICHNNAHHYLALPPA